MLGVLLTMLSRGLNVSLAKWTHLCFTPELSGLRLLIPRATGHVQIPMAGQEPLSLLLTEQRMFVLQSTWVEKET
jgi:hypothetical protein